MNKDFIEQLILKKDFHELSDEERRELQEWVQNEDEYLDLRTAIKVATGAMDYSEKAPEFILTSLMQSLPPTFDYAENRINKKRKRKKKILLYTSLSIAASISFITGFYLITDREIQNVSTVEARPDQTEKHEVHTEKRTIEKWENLDKKSEEPSSTRGSGRDDFFANLQKTDDGKITDTEDNTVTTNSKPSAERIPQALANMSNPESRFGEHYLSGNQFSEADDGTSVQQFKMSAATQGISAKLANNTEFLEISTEMYK